MRNLASAVRFLLTTTVILSLGISTCAIADGPFDPTFGYEGLSFYLSGRSATPYGMTQDSQNRLLVAASLEKQLAVTRHSTNGNLDTSFGAGGIASNFVFVTGDDLAWASSVVMDHQGRIVVGGGLRGTASCDGGGSATVRDYLIVRLLNGEGADGSLDPTFGSLGLAFYGDCSVITQGVHGLAVGSDNSVFAIGTAADSHGVERATVVKWTPDGKNDTSYGRSGVSDYTRSTLGETDGMALAIDADGRLLATTESFASPSQSGALVRFTAQGELDPLFGVAGVVDLGELTPDIFIHTGGLCCVQMDGRGRIVIAGLKLTEPSDGSGIADTAAFVARFTDKGVPDEAFGRHGFAIVGNGEFQSVTALAVDGHDRPVLEGTLKSPYAAVPAAVIYQLNQDGSANEAVGFNGVFSAEFGYDNFPTSLLVDAGGNIVVGATESRDAVSVLLRYDQIFGEGFD